MALLNWNDNLSVGISSIDKQHQKLIELYNNFYESIINRDTKEKMTEVVKGLKDYTVYHFKDEEAVMKRHNYPGYKLQKEDHDKFIKAVLDLEERYKNGKMILSIEIINFIRDWIANHILNIDKQYTTFLQQKGVK